MSTSHGETVVQKPISEFAKFFKNLIPINIPDSYPINPILKKIASEEDIRNGIIAFRDFVIKICDCLISDGHIYTKPLKSKNPNDYPFLININHLLVEIGYFSNLEKNNASLIVNNIPLVTDIKPKITVPKMIESFSFLARCGFVFAGIDLDNKKHTLADIKTLEIFYPENPLLLTGLKALAIADMELRNGRRYWNDYYLLRCYYRSLRADETDMLEVLKDFIYPLPDEVQNFAIELHNRYTKMGMTCVSINDDAVRLAYSYIGNSKRVLSPRDMYQNRVFELNASMKGYCIFVRAKKTDKNIDIIEKLPVTLKEKIAIGYGCDRKRGERCQKGCQGIHIPLDDSVFEIEKDIIIWLDSEMPKALK